MLGAMIASGELAREPTTAVLDALLGSLRGQNALLATHPNSSIYSSLATVLEIDGHFLETEPIHGSNQPELPSTQAKLDSLKARRRALGATAARRGGRSGSARWTHGGGHLPGRRRPSSPTRA